MWGEGECRGPGNFRYGCKPTRLKGILPQLSLNSKNPKLPPTVPLELFNMAWLSAYTLIRIICSAHLLAGVLLIKSPQLLTEQPIIFLLGEAIGLVRRPP